MNQFTFQLAAALAALTCSACAPQTVSLPVEQRDITSLVAPAAEHRRQQNIDCWLNHRGDLQIGMTQKEVAATCWNFERRHATDTATGTYDQWVYDLGPRASVYLYFTDSVLTAISD